MNITLHTANEIINYLEELRELKEFKIGQKRVEQLDLDDKGRKVSLEAEIGILEYDLENLTRLIREIRNLYTEESFDEDLKKEFYDFLVNFNIKMQGKDTFDF